MIVHFNFPQKDEFKIINLGLWIHDSDLICADVCYNAVHAFPARFVPVYSRLHQTPKSLFRQVNFGELSSKNGG